MDFDPAPSRGGLIGLGLVAALVVVQLGLVGVAAWLGLGPPATVLVVVAVLLIPVVARLVYWVWAYATLRYHVGRDGVVVRWGAADQVIPMDDITHVLNGRPYGQNLQGFHWPGHEVGRATLATDDGVVHPLLVYATRPPADQVVIVTPDLAYAISPADRVGFVDEFRARSRLGPVHRLSQGTEPRLWARLPLWHDGVALRLVAVALVLNLIAFAWLMWRHPALPAQVPLQMTYDPQLRAPVPGVPRPVAALWFLPLVGLAATLLNMGLAVRWHQRVRLAALLLLLGAVLLQLALGVVLWQVT